MFSPATDRGAANGFTARPERESSVSIDRFPEARDLRVIVQIRKLGAGRATRTRRYTQETLPADLACDIPCPAAACRNGGLRYARLYLMVVDTLSRKEANTRTVADCQSVKAAAPDDTREGSAPTSSPSASPPRTAASGSAGVAQALVCPRLPLLGGPLPAGLDSPQDMPTHGMLNATSTTTIAVTSPAVRAGGAMWR